MQDYANPDLAHIALANLEQRVTSLTMAIERQNMQVGRIADILVDLRNRSDWNAAQVGELLRILSTGIRDIRQTQIYSLLAEGPVSVDALIKLQSVPVEPVEPNRLTAQVA
jgi:hypothetical protein